MLLIINIMLVRFIVNSHSIICGEQKYLSTNSTNFVLVICGINYASAFVYSSMEAEKEKVIVALDS